MGAVDRSAAGDGPSVTVLLVEDQDTVRELVRQILLRSGYEVYEAVDGQQATGILDTIRDDVDLVVTDVVMPNMGGADLVAHARRVVPDVPALFISGYATEEALPGLDDDPRTDFLQKPFTLADFGAKVDALLRVSAAGD